jgi:hypothetical protein
MTRLEETRREVYRLGGNKKITSEVHVSLASEPFGRRPTGRNRFVYVFVFVCVNVNSKELKSF